jgi:autotransporter adhesin
VQNYTANGSSVIASSSVSGPAAATGSNSFAAGAGAKATGSDSTALGDRAQAAGTPALALGSQANAAANNSVALGANAEASRDNTVSVGAPGSERQVVNVAAGMQGTDAVNVNQLNAAVAGTNQQISGLQGQINNVAKGANAGTAAAMAVAGLPQPTQPGKTMVALAGARYGGQSGRRVRRVVRDAEQPVRREAVGQHEHQRQRRRRGGRRFSVVMAAFDGGA